MPRWDFEYEYAGYRLTQQRIRAKWLDRASVLSAARMVSSVSISFNPPFDFAEVAASADPHSGYGTLSLVDDNGTSHKVFEGLWTNVEYGDSSEAVQVTLARSGEGDVNLIPGAYSITEPGPRSVMLGKVARRLAEFRGLPFADTVAWPNVDQVDRGATYVIVYGAPGDADAPGSPAFIVDDPGSNYRVLCVGEPADTAAEFVMWIVESGSGSSEPGSITKLDGPTLLLQLENIEDARGRMIASFLVLQTLVKISALNKDKRYIQWKSAPVVEGAGNIIAAVMRRSSVRFDRSRSEAAIQRLNAYKLDGYIDQQVSPLQWVQKVALPILPASLISGPDGLYLRLWPWLDGGDEVAFEVTEGRDFSASGMVRYHSASASTITLRYAWSPLTGDYRKEKTVRASNSLYARGSQALSSRSQEIKTRGVWDDTTAQMILNDRIRYGSIPARIRRYTCDATKYGIGGTHELRVGMPIKITDDTVSWSGLLAWIDEIERTGDSLAVLVRIREW